MRTFNHQNPLTNQEIQALAPSVFTQQAHHSLSDRYSFISTAEVLDGLRGAGYEVFAANQSRVRLPDKTLFAKHALSLRLAGTSLANVGDIVLGVQLTNSHSGSAAFSLAFALLRLACSNGLIVADSTIQSVHLRHTGDLVNRVVSGTQDLLSRGPEVAETVKLWKTIDVAPNEALLLAEQAHSLRFDEESNLAKAISPEHLLTVHRHEDIGTDLWTRFNVIQENAIRGGLRGHAITNTPEGGQEVRRVRTRTVKGIDQSNKLNRALWQISQHFAAEKGATIA